MEANSSRPVQSGTSARQAMGPGGEGAREAQSALRPSRVLQLLHFDTQVPTRTSDLGHAFNAEGSIGVGGAIMYCSRMWIPLIRQPPPAPSTVHVRRMAAP
jgi:hypothetical protein